MKLLCDIDLEEGQRPPFLRKRMPGGVGGDLDDSRIEADYRPFRKGNRAVRKPTCDSVPRNRLRVKRIIPTFSNVPLPFSTRTPSPRGRRGVTRRRWQQFRRAFNRLRQEVERGPPLNQEDGPKRGGPERGGPDRR